MPLIHLFVSIGNFLPKLSIFLPELIIDGFLVPNKISHNLAEINNGLFKNWGLRGCLARLRVLRCPWLPREIRIVPPIWIVGVAIWSIVFGLEFSNNICLVPKHFSHNWHRRTLWFVPNWCLSWFVSSWCSLIEGVINKIYNLLRHILG